MAHTLVLNATYEPLGVVPDRRALLLVLTEKAITVEESGSVDAQRHHGPSRCPR